MREALDFLETPLFNNFYAKFDKKLRKNVVKRCAVEPLIERIFSPPPNTTTPQGADSASDEEDEAILVAPFLKDEGLMDALTEVLLRVVKDGVATEALCGRLAPSLRIFLRLV